MFHRFFKQPLNILKTHQRVIENSSVGVAVASSLYLYPKATKKWIHSHMTLFYDQLSEEKKSSIHQDPKKEHEFVEDCKYQLRLIMGPPD